MSQDQLTKYERLRLESFAQAALTAMTIATEQPTLDKLFENARRIEEFLKGANPN